MITYLPPLGLALDLIGVVLLGVDLIRIQVSQKVAVIKNSERLEELLRDLRYPEESRFAGTGVGDSEGFDWDGGSDPYVISKNFASVAATLDNHAMSLEVITSYLKRSVEEQAEMASRSLPLSYLGLSLIAVGFFLQGLPFLGASLGWS